MTVKNDQIDVDRPPAAAGERHDRSRGVGFPDMHAEIGAAPTSSRRRRASPTARRLPRRPGRRHDAGDDPAHDHRYRRHRSRSDERRHRPPGASWCAAGCGRSRAAGGGARRRPVRCSPGARAVPSRRSAAGRRPTTSIAEPVVAKVSRGGPCPPPPRARRPQGPVRARPGKKPEGRAARQPEAETTTDAGRGGERGGGPVTGGEPAPETTVPTRPATAHRPLRRRHEAADLAGVHGRRSWSPLPDDDGPLLVYMGLTKNGKTAKFLVDAAARGRRRRHLQAAPVTARSSSSRSARPSSSTSSTPRLDEEQASRSERGRPRETGAPSPRRLAARPRRHQARRRLRRSGRGTCHPPRLPASRGGRCPHRIPGVTLRVITAGESHGPGLTCIVEGLPAGLELDLDAIDRDMARRQLGHGRGGRMKIERDSAEVTSGVRHGRTLGGPIALRVANRDYANWEERMNPWPVEAEVPEVHLPRPGHADLAGVQKFGFTDVRNVLERASARETAARVAGGALAKGFLRRARRRGRLPRDADRLRAGARARRPRAGGLRRGRRLAGPLPGRRRVEGDGRGDQRAAQGATSRSAASSRCARSASCPGSART